MNDRTHGVIVSVHCAKIVPLGRGGGDAEKMDSRKSGVHILLSRKRLGLAGAAQNVHQLVANQFLDVGTGGLQVLTRIELVGMLVEELTDGAGHCKTQVGVDVDLADGQGSCLTQLLFGDTDGVGHLAAVGVDHLDVLLGNGGRTVQNDGEAGQTLVTSSKTSKRRAGGTRMPCSFTVHCSGVNL